MISGPIPSPRMTVIVCGVIAKSERGHGASKAPRGGEDAWWKTPGARHPARHSAKPATHYARRPGMDCRSAVVVGARGDGSSAFRPAFLQRVQEVDGAAQVRDHDRTAD